jgi:hypothetical protein
MRCRAWAVVFLGAVLLAPAAQATEIPEGTYGDTTWSAADGPYRITGNVDFSSLTIEAGTTVLLATLDSGATRRVTISTDALTVNGTRESPVTFRPDVDTDSHGAWQGIYVHGPASVRGAVLVRAADGIFGWGNQDPSTRVTIRESVFDSGSYAVMGSSDMDLDAVLVTGGVGHGVWISNAASTIRITNSVFQVDNPIYGAHARISVVNCTIDHSYVAVELGSTDATLELRNTIVSNGLVGLRVGTPSPSSPQIKIFSSDFWQNTQTFDGLASPPTVLSVDPRYVSAADLHLSPGGPCIDAGTAVGAPDHDFSLLARPQGAAVDIGAYEYVASGGSGGGGGSGGNAGGNGGGGGGRAGGGGGGSGNAGAGGGGGGSGNAGAGGGSGGGGGSGTRPGGSGGGAGSGNGVGAGAGGGGGGGGSAGTGGGPGGGGCGCRVEPGPSFGSWLSLLVVAWFARRARARSRQPKRPVM